MRKLMQQQKDILKQFPSITDVDALPYGVWEEVVKLGDYETIVQDADRYLWDNFCGSNPDAFHYNPLG